MNPENDLQLRIRDLEKGMLALIQIVKPLTSDIILLPILQEVEQALRARSGRAKG